MDARSLALVPLPAKELLDGAINLRLEYDRTRRELLSILRMETDTPYGAWMAMRDHETELLRERVDTAESVIKVLQQGGNADENIRAWRQAVYKHERRTA